MSHHTIRRNRSQYVRLHVREGHFRDRLLKLLTGHRAVCLLGQPDSHVWALLAELVKDKIISLANTHGRAFLAVRGSMFARLGRVAP